MTDRLNNWTRHIIALVFTCAGAITLMYLAIVGNRDALSALVIIVTGVTNFYLGHKIGSAGADNAKT